MGGWNSRMGQEQDEVGGETHQNQSSLFLQSERIDNSSQSNETCDHKFKMADNPKNYAIYEDEVKSSENECSEEDSGVYSNNDDSDESQVLHKSG